MAAALGVARHLELDLDLSQFGGSALTADIAVPKDRALDAAGHSGDLRAGAQHDLPVARAWPGPRCSAPTTIVIGVNALDYSGYPDCRPEFIDAFERLADARDARRRRGAARSRSCTPLITLTKADIIALGLSLGLDYGLTHSCYDPRPTGGPAGAATAAGCAKPGFAAAGVADPLSLALDR